MRVFVVTILITLQFSDIVLAVTCRSGYNECNGKCYSCPSGTTLSSDCSSCTCNKGKFCYDDSYTFEGMSPPGSCYYCEDGYYLNNDCTSCIPNSGTIGETLIDPLGSIFGRRKLSSTVSKAVNNIASICTASNVHILQD